MQVKPAVRRWLLQASLAGVESIHKRIRRLREAKGLSQEQLAAAAGVKYQSVQEWEREQGTAPSRKRQAAVAKALGVTVSELMVGGNGKDVSAEHHPDAVARDARGEILLHLYRGLFSLQQESLIASLRALFQANQITRKELGQSALRGVSDDEVRRAFGDAPFHRMKKLKRKTTPRRDLGDAMGDFIDE